MSTAYNADNESSTSSSSKSVQTDSSDDEFKESINCLISAKHKKRIKKKKKRHTFSPSKFKTPAYQHPPPPMMYSQPMPQYYPAQMGYAMMMTNQYQQELQQLHAKLTQQIEYNEKRIAKRKNKKRIKKQRNNAASKIQTWWKKWSVIQKWRDPLSSLNIQRLLMNNDIANSYLDELIEEYFAYDFIPELLIEILTTKDDEFYQKDVISQIAWSFYETIELEVCHKIAKDVANDAIQELVYKYFKINESNRLHLGSILIHIQNEIIDEVLLTESKSIVDESIEELIVDYLIDCKAMELYDEILPVIIEDTVDSSITEYILETDVIDGFFFDQCLNEWTKEIVNEEYDDYKQKMSDENKAKEFDLKEKDMKSHKTNARTKQNVILNETLMRTLCDTAIDPFIDFLKNA